MPGNAAVGEDSASSGVAQLSCGSGPAQISGGGRGLLAAPSSWPLSQVTGQPAGQGSSAPGRVPGLVSQPDPIICRQVTQH